MQVHYSGRRFVRLGPRQSGGVSRPWRSIRSTGVTMPQQSLSDFVSAMEAAGMLVRVSEEKRVDELPRVMEDHPTTAVLVEKVTGCEFSFLANAYSNQDQYAWAMGCKKAETGMKMVEASQGTYRARRRRDGAL